MNEQADAQADVERMFPGIEQVKLPPLSEVDQDHFDTPAQFTTLVQTPHQHTLVMKDPTTVCCTGCGAGWTGPDVYLLYEASLAIDSLPSVQ